MKVVFEETEQDTEDNRHVPKTKKDAVLWERWRLITIVKIKDLRHFLDK